MHNHPTRRAMPLLRFSLLLPLIVLVSISQGQTESVSLLRVSRSGSCTQGAGSIRPPASVRTSIRNRSICLGPGAWTQGPLREPLRRFSDTERPFLSHVRHGMGLPDSTKARVWQYNVYLGAQVFAGTALAGHFEITKRHGRHGHALSIGYCHVLRRLQPENFSPRWLPFQYSYFQGRRHHWEMGAGIQYGDGTYYQLQLPFETLRGRSFLFTWTPIGYRFDGIDSRLRIRIYPNMVWAIYELEGPYKEYLEGRRRDNKGERSASFCFSIGWRI